MRVFVHLRPSRHPVIFTGINTPMIVGPCLLVARRGDGLVGGGVGLRVFAAFDSIERLGWQPRRHDRGGHGRRESRWGLRRRIRRSRTTPGIGAGHHDTHAPQRPKASTIHRSIKTRKHDSEVCGGRQIRATPKNVACKATTTTMNTDRALSPRNPKTRYSRNFPWQARKQSPHNVQDQPGRRFRMSSIDRAS